MPAASGGVIMAVKITVASAKGGVGKSTVCAGLGRALAGRGKKVLLCDMDIGLRSLDLILGVSAGCVYNWGDVLLGNCESEKAVMSVVSKLSLMCAPFDANTAFEGAEFAGMIDRIADGFDYIIFDSPAGLDSGFLLGAAAAHRAIVVSTPDDVSIRAAGIAADKLSLLGVKDSRLIINRYNKKEAVHTLDDVIDGVSVRLLGVVPEDSAMRLLSSGFEAEDASRAIRAFSRIAARMCGEKVPLRL